MNRRQRRRLQALIALCLFCVVIGTLLGMRHTGEVLHTQQTQALGTSILIGAQGSESRPALAAAEREIERLDALFAYDGDGDIAKLNAEGSITARRRHRGAARARKRNFCRNRRALQLHSGTAARRLAACSQRPTACRRMLS